MSDKIVKLENNTEELSTINELIAGCDSAVVTYGVDQNYNVHKVVTLYTRVSGFAYQGDEFGACHSKTLGMEPNMALCKRYDYKITGSKVKKIFANFHKQLLRTLTGFVKDATTQDLRGRYER